MEILVWLTSGVALAFVAVWIAALLWAAVEDGRAERRESRERRGSHPHTPLGR